MTSRQWCDDEILIHDVTYDLTNVAMTINVIVIKIEKNEMTVRISI